MVISGVDGSTAMAAGYALFLGLVALFLELLAKHSHRRAEGYRVAGFQYDAGLDAWHCPTGRRLNRAEIRHDRRTIIYRAPAHHCNCCRIKTECTDSNTGRTVERRLDSWLDSELRRFHIGISLALLVLAASILIIELLLHEHEGDRVILAGALAIVGVPGLRIAHSFFSSRSRSQTEPDPAEY
jgi:hypothetical protein